MAKFTYKKNLLYRVDNTKQQNISYHNTLKDAKRTARKKSKKCGKSFWISKRNKQYLYSEKRYVYFYNLKYQILEDYTHKIGK